MYDFPTSVQSATDITSILVHLGLVAVLGVLFWFAVRRPAPKSSNKFRVWLVLSIAATLGQLVGFATFPIHVQAAIWYGTAAMIICMIGGLREFLRAERERDLEPALGFIQVGTILVFQFVLSGWLLLPQQNHHANASRRTQCKNNLKQIALGMHYYHDIAGRFPPAAARTVNPASPLPSSWRVALLPFMEQTHLFESYDHERSWDSSENLPIASRRIEQYLCPSQPESERHNEASQFFTSYVVPVGQHSVFARDGKPAHALSEIKDGSSNSLLVMEACGTRIVWTNPQDINVDSTQIGVNLPGNEPGLSAGILSSYHTAGANAALADGSVRFISADTDPTILKALLTVDGGEKVGEY